MKINEAALLVAEYFPMIEGKQLPQYPEAIVKEVEVIELEGGSFKIEVMALDKRKYTWFRCNFIECLKTFNIVIDKERF